MFNKTSVMRTLAAIINDAGFAYSWYGFVPNVPIEFWSRREHVPDADESCERDQVRPPSSVRSQTSSGIAARQGPLAGPI